ncbi:MAG: flagellar biosynthetic protein FliR [Rhodospirillaceae bacterium]|mgnify:CR=1 FL=1|nr:flagellar biosynthetic protein FliR [Rhodospirillaceae bacterium]|tara:strand:- start:132 stop:899 length:768 start_codon:yes stop_codon:yes gene_type:complete
MALEQFLPLQVYAFLIVFARVAATVMLIPGIGEAFVPIKVRLLFALLLTIIIAPLVSGSLPPEPRQVVELFRLLAVEIVIGIYIGIVAKIMLLTLDTVGRFIGVTIGMANAEVFNPSISSQASLPGLLLTTMGVMILFATNMHHTLILAVTDSYNMFPVGKMLLAGDSAFVVARLIGDSFRLALQLAAPFIVISLIFFMGLGMLARLMPQLQIFFVGLPVQLAGGLFLFSAILSGLFSIFLEYYATHLNQFLSVN